MSPRLPAPTRSPRRPATLAVRRRDRGGPPAVARAWDGVLDITDWAVVDSWPAPAALPQPQAAAAGLALAPGRAAPLPTPRHPRRTRTLRWTCKLCDATTHSPVNPRAWAGGAVFATCGGCATIHKLRDNLGLFHELAGPVFPGRGA